MQIDEQLEVETPEGALLTLSLAGPVPRALAYSIDLAIRMVIYGILGAMLAIFGKFGMGLAAILAFFLEWFYPTLFEAFRNGQTPGKKAMGLAVIHANGSPLSFNGSLIRNLLRTADIFPMFYLTGFVACLLSSRQQRLGDMAANTLVVHLADKHDGKTLTAGEHLAPDWHLSRDDQLTLLAYHERAEQLSPQRRQELAQLAYPELPAAQAEWTLAAITRHLIGGQAPAQQAADRPLTGTTGDHETGAV
ncbi:MAG: RDD family protein [Alcanivorax sp.]|nr:RDD family protein [Alcanivorax sp.]